MNDSIHKQYSNEVKGLKFDIFERRYSKVFQNLYLAGSQSASWELQDAWQQTGRGGLPRDSQCGQCGPPRGHTGDRGAAAAGHPLHAHLIPPESGDPSAPTSHWPPSPQVLAHSLVSLLQSLAGSGLASLASHLASLLLWTAQFVWWPHDNDIRCVMTCARCAWMLNCPVLNLGEGGKIVLNRKMQGFKSGGQS